MNRDTLELVQACLAITAALLALGGLVARFVLLPWLRDHLVDPLKETRRQVAVNGHQTPNDPTLLDKVDSLTTEAREARLASLAAGHMLEGHLDRSADEWGRLWAAIGELQHPPRNRRREDTPHASP